MLDFNILNVMSILAKGFIAVVDHTKFGKAKFIPVLPLEQVDIIITDSGIAKEEIDSYRSEGVSIVVAEPLTELS